MKKLKVLHVIPSYLPAYKLGGPIESVHLLNKGLVDEGVDVDVITTTSGQCENKTDTGIWINQEGVKVKYYKSFFYNNYTFSPGLFIELCKIVRNYDLVHITAVWNFPTLIATVLCKLYKKPYMISTRGALYPAVFNYRNNVFKKLYWHLVAKHYIVSANSIHCTVVSEKEEFERFLKIKVRSSVIPNGICLSDYEELPDRDRFKDQYKILKGKKYLLFLSRINFKKGLDLLIESFKELSSRYDDLYLVIAGPDNEGYQKNVEVWIDNYSLRDKVIFTGMLKGTDKLSAYTGAEAFILPSYSENFGMVVVESMACGTPVIISNEVGIHDVVSENSAGIITTTEVENITKSIDDLLNDEEKKKRIIANALAMLKSNYSIKSVSKSMIKEYKKLLS